MLETDPGLPNLVFRLDRSLAQGNCMCAYSAFAYDRRLITHISLYWIFLGKCTACTTDGQRFAAVGRSQQVQKQ